MDNIYISGYGLFLANIKTAKDFLRLIDEKEEILCNKIEELKDVAEQKQYRRMDRFSILSVLSAKALLDSAEETLSPYRCASIINTSYGCLDTNLDFIQDILSDDISPIKFSHTVYNASLGHVCKNFGIKGASTMVLSSNYIYVAMALLSSGKADYVLAGGIEVYIQELENYFKSIGIKTSECGCFVGLTKTLTKKCLARIVDFNECNFGGHPYLDDTKIDAKKILHNINSALINANISKEDINIIISSSISYSMPESEAISQLFMGTEIINLNYYIGETLGASLGVNLLYAALKLNNTKGKYALVNNFDLGGNYVSYILSSIE